jgi:hypothetical protein
MKEKREIACGKGLEFAVFRRTAMKMAEVKVLCFQSPERDGPKNICQLRGSH